MGRDSESGGGNQAAIAHASPRSPPIIAGGSGRPRTARRRGVGGLDTGTTRAVPRAGEVVTPMRKG